LQTVKDGVCFLGWHGSFACVLSRRPAKKTEYVEHQGKKMISLWSFCGKTPVVSQININFANCLWQACLLGARKLGTDEKNKDHAAHSLPASLAKSRKAGKEKQCGALAR